MDKPSTANHTLSHTSGQDTCTKCGDKYYLSQDEFCSESKQKVIKPNFKPEIAARDKLIELGYKYDSGEWLTPEQLADKKRDHDIYDMCVSIDNFTEEAMFWAGKFYDAPTTK